MSLVAYKRWLIYLEVGQFSFFMFLYGSVSFRNERFKYVYSILSLNLICHYIEI